jgi:DNA polymerase II large subunit
MATRRTTMRSRSGTKLYAVRDKSGKFKDIQSYRKAHAADLRRTSKAEAGAKEKLVAMEKTVERAAKKAVKTVRAKIDEARANKKVIAMERKVGRAAKKAATTVRASLTDAVAAVRRAAKKVAKRVSAAKPAAKKAVKKAAAKRPAKSR